MQDHLRELIDLIEMIISLLFSFLYAQSLTLSFSDDLIELNECVFKCKIKN